MSHQFSAPLPRRALGSTGIAVSCLGLGTVKIGRNEGVKYPTGFQLPDDARVRDILALCRDAGMNLIDTAPAYGSSEERLGKLLVQRQDWVICSKVGEEFSAGKSHFDFSATHVRRSIERSLQRLKTDYLDIVLVHSDGRDEALLQDGECLDALRRCRDAGLIRAIGMSTKTVAGGLLAVEQTDVVMVTYNPDATDDAAVIARAHALRKGVLIKKALNSGHGSAKGTGTGSLPADGAPGTKNVQEPFAVQHSLEFIFAQPGVSAIIIGSITPAHLTQNIEAALRATAAR
jgi:aryl-alcohol dehydrogenase-like predicted oxidoreductase